MKIAVLSDVHCNLHSLHAVLEDIATEKPDMIICAGDMVGSSIYPHAVDVWNTLQTHKIPCVMGNEEQRIVNYYESSADSKLRNSVQFMPVQYRARQFQKSSIDLMSSLPKGIHLEGPNQQDVFICHGSPNNLSKSPMNGIDEVMAGKIRKINAEVIVVGHMHTRWHQYWNEKLLVMAGSAGLPIRGKVDEVDYLILTYLDMKWEFQYKSVKYDFQTALNDVIQSDALKECGPIGWLMFVQILTREDHLMVFFHKYCPENSPDEINYWKKLVGGYLDQTGIWEMVEPYIKAYTN